MATDQGKTEMDKVTLADYYKHWKRASTTYEPLLLAESVYALSLNLIPSNVVILSAMVAWFVGSRGTKQRNHAPTAEPMCYVNPRRLIW